ncbi:nucleotidyltransferase [Candidatus Uhrbacteria bacterium RIFCSPLOWO2_02_FULL_48_12]|uniref:Nucleotidyltransferase n=1 Tax=Candidatus Uhrbacteria bacterium RIFCSPLOWO2_02_FULL_48_12 TaxID=1802407 RepID=A0A1F7V9I3_9BACT|nr:MAG: nucleotidyltransferase [Candidatus Uhrbacteria bacterium RIFCSPLOWO2_02_FULL_48_12]
MQQARFSISDNILKQFCQRHGIVKLSLFGSVLRDDFGPESDVDVLVEFATGHHVGLIRLSAIERELSAILGRKVDLQTPGFLSPHFRSNIIEAADVRYVAP